jgi:hypothetical protein
MIAPLILADFTLPALLQTLFEHAGRKKKGQARRLPPFLPLVRD